MKSISDILKNLTAGSKNILWKLGLHAFWVILFFVLIDFIIGGFIFYKYVFLAERAVPQASENIIKFDSKAYQSVLEKIQPELGN